MISAIGHRAVSLNAREFLEPDDVNVMGMNTALPPTIIGGFSVARPALGLAVIDLKDGYQLAINDTERRIVLENKIAKSSTIIWGDAAISPTPPLMPAPLSPTSTQSASSEASASVSVAPQPEMPQPIAPAAVAIELSLPPVTAPPLAVQSAPPVSMETLTGAPLPTPTPLSTSVPTPEPTPTPEPPLKFWGTISFVFGNDQKITLNTLPSPTGDGSCTIDKIVVTSESNGLIIGGAADQTAGALNITAASGYDLDEDTRDGLTLEECANGTGWKNEDGIALSQFVLNATAVGADYGPGSKFMSMREMNIMLSRVFSFSFINVMMSSVMTTRNALNQSSEIRTDSEKSSDRRRIERLIVDQILAQQAAEIRRMENDRIPLS